MNVPSSTPVSKGMNMVAAYRAARLSQRPVLRGTLQDSHAARRMARVASQPSVEPDDQVAPEIAPAGPLPAAVPDTQAPGSVFANLVSTSVTTEPDEAAAGEAVHDHAAVAGNSDAPPRHAAELATAASAEPANLEPAEPAAPPPGEPAALPPTEPAVAQTGEPAPLVADAAAPAPYDPPLAQIGFGPGMLIRLSQLGLHTTADLARADPEQLRSELGDISRLVDVEAWILNARQTVFAEPNRCVAN